VGRQAHHRVAMPDLNEGREPGWYWVREYRGSPWHPRRWFIGKTGDRGWLDRLWGWEPFEIGPKIESPEDQ
jgi:hypothetical protein